jgi:hypothetical protein
VQNSIKNLKKVSEIDKSADHRLILDLSLDLAPVILTGYEQEIIN